jgi:hypothetical protein
LQVEANLRSRCSEAEAEARGAAERERLAQERMKQHADGTEALQVTTDLHRPNTLPSLAHPLLLPLVHSLLGFTSLTLLNGVNSGKGICYADGQCETRGGAKECEGGG